MKKINFKSKKSKISFDLLLILTLSTIIYLGMLLTQKIFPFGTSSLMGGDVTGQYIPFFSYLKNVIFSNDSSIFSFSKLFGGNMFGIWSYYLLSPYNIFFIIFPLQYFSEALTLITGLKLITCAITMYFFISRYTQNKLIKIILPLCYAFCGFNIAFLVNIMWIDSVIMLPLVCIGIEKLFENKYKFYLITLSITLIGNFYMAFAICIFAVIYFCYMSLINFKSTEDLKKILKAFCSFAIISIISALLATCILLPTINVLSGGRGSSIEINLQDIKEYNFNIIDLGYKLLPGSINQNEIFSGLPNIYTGIICIILVEIYFVRKDISLKEKIIYALMLVFLIFNFNNRLINLLWSGFKNPTGYYYRYSFLYSFMILLISAKSLNNISKDDLRKLLPFCILNIIIFYLIYKIGYEPYLRKVLKVSIALFILYSIMLYLSINFKNKGKIFSLGIVLLLCIELIFNYQRPHNSLNCADRNEYISKANNYNNIIKNVKEMDNSFYRMEKTTCLTLNDALLNNYNGLGHSSSTFDESYYELMRNIGYTYYLDWPSYGYGNTLLTDSLFGLKYIVTNKNENYRNYEKVLEDNNFDVQKNPNYLSLGYYAKNIGQDIENSNNSPFDLQTYYLNQICGENLNYFDDIPCNYTYNNVKLENGKLSKIIPDSAGSIKINFNKSTNDIIYLYASSTHWTAPGVFDVYVNGINNGDYVGIVNNGIREIKSDTNNVEIELVFKWNEVTLNELSLKKFNTDNFNKAISLIKNHDQLENIKVNNNKITADINMNDSGYLFTTIPLDENFKVKVDGNIVKPEKAFDKFIALNLNEGNHYIELVYRYSYLTYGSIISVITLISLITYYIINKKKHSKI